MDVLKNCRIYEFSKYYNPTLQNIKLDRGKLGITNDPISSSTDLNEIQYLHLIEYGFHISKFKSNLIQNCIKNLQKDGNGDEKCILFIDLLSIWKDHLMGLEIVNNDNEKDNVGIYYLNSVNILNMESLMKFFAKLIDDPIDSLRKYCQFPKNVNYRQQLSGIVIDNISYFTYDDFNNIQRNVTSYTLLLKMLKTLRKTFGCWVITVSYGIEFYDGVETTTSHLYRSGSHTRVPLSYTSGMDTLILRDTESTGRFCNM